MAVQERAGDLPIASMRIKLKYADVDTFVQKYAANISRTGLFISSRQPKPIGTHLKFEIILTGAGTEESILRGEGRVQVTREYDPNQPNRAHGMAVKFERIDEVSQLLVARVLAYKESQRGEARLPANALEVPPAVARLAAETQAPLPTDIRPLAEADGSSAKLQQLAAEWNVDAARVAQILAEPRRQRVADLESELNALLQPLGPTPVTLEEALRELPVLLADKALVIELDAIPQDEELSNELAMSAPRAEAHAPASHKHAR